MAYSKNRWNKQDAAVGHDKRVAYKMERIEDGVSDAHATLRFATCVDGEFRCGESTGSYCSLSSSGFVTLAGDARAWEDLRFDANALKAAGVKDPAYSTVLGTLRGYTFSPTTQEELYFAVQMPHSWSGEAIHPHVHWFTATASTNVTCRWGLEYAWADIGSTFSAPTTIYASTVSPVTTIIESKKHYVTSFSSLVPSTNQDGFSAMLLCRLFRDSTVAADTFDQNANLLEFDIHYSVKRLGTKTEFDG